MKIWFLTSEFPPEFGGGVGMYVDQASKMFARGNHQVTVFVRDGEKDKVEEPEKGLRYVRFLHCKGEIYQTLGYWAALSYQYAEVIMQYLQTEEKPDIIEVQEYGAIGYYLLLYKLLGKKILEEIPIVVHLHTPVFELTKINQSPQYQFPNYWIGQMEKFCLKAADSLICPSHFLKEQLKEKAGENEIHVMPLPYQVEEIENYPKRQPENNTIVYGGRTEFRKGIYQSLRIFEELWLEGYQVKLKIFGGDTNFHPKNAMLGTLIKEKYSRWIKQGLLELHASIPPKELDKEFLKAKAVIVPSIYENFPYSCVTAMWLGTPMLVSRQGGQAEMVEENGVNGLIFDWEKKDLKEKLITLLSMDEKETEQLGENGKNRIFQLCNIEENRRNRERYYQNVIKHYQPKKQFPFLNSEIERKPLIKKEKVTEGLLSIIIPYYNLGDYIMETIESANKISYKNAEIIIINDGTTQEASIKKLEEIKKIYPKVEIISIKNGGLANARNVGAFHARGEFITFLDADDLIDFSFYEKAIHILQKFSNVSFVYSWVQYFENGTGIWPTFSTEFPYLLCANMLSAFCVVRKNDFLNYGQNRRIMEYGMEDYDGWIGLCENGYFGVSIPEPLVQYRVRNNSMSRQFNINMRTYLNEQITKAHSSIYQKYGEEIFHLLLQNGPSYRWNNPTFALTTEQVNEVKISGDVQANKAELLRIANSKWGARIIRWMIKLKINRLFQ